MSNMLILQKLLVFLFCHSFIVKEATAHELVKNYIVYMGDVLHATPESTISSNHEVFGRVTNTRARAKEGVIYHYTKSFRGFSALLTPDEAASLSEMDDVISVFESKTRHVQTTHSWEFLGINQINSMTTNNLIAQSNVIVGVIDTGVWPESESFIDVGLPPVPSRFKGTCETGENFTAHNCNRKIIGARFYSKGFEASNGPLESSVLGKTFFRSPRDADGHGTHTASTVAGAEVKNASVMGIGRGTAKGGVPGARLAIYKACWFNNCEDADLLAAFDDAVKDGVDIISISVGPEPPQPNLFEDGIEIGSFHAFRSGIVVSASAGNSGFPGSVINLAPWILTVGASSMDRSFTSNLLLGNNLLLEGEAMNPHKQNGFAGLVAASRCAAPGISQEKASLCLGKTLDPSKVKGKIVVCTVSGPLDNSALKTKVVEGAGGVGIIVIDPIGKNVTILFAIPGTAVGLEQGARIMAYLASEKNPTAYIKSTSTVLNNRPAPQMAVFSSQGPNIIIPDIIKPDITAPGVNILAAWSPVALNKFSDRPVDFNMISGSSMSCPHVSAVAALLKSQNPTWSPAAIKSAIMTTAFVTDNTKKPILRSPAGNLAGPFDYGSGHIDPMAALDPGLVYDYNVTDVINVLCSNGATPAQLRNLAGEEITCVANPLAAYNLNYPSIGVANLKGNVTLSRTLTSYASGASVYRAVVKPPPGVVVDVLPKVLSFKQAGQKLSFTVKLTVKEAASSFVFGSLTWIDGKHKVYSPIAVNPTSAYSS